MEPEFWFKQICLMNIDLSYRIKIISFESLQKAKKIMFSLTYALYFEVKLFQLVWIMFLLMEVKKRIRYESSWYDTKR